MGWETQGELCFNLIAESDVTLVVYRSRKFGSASDALLPALPTQHLSNVFCFDRDPYWQKLNFVHLLIIEC